MRILITGGGGFIGRNLKERMAERHEICAPGHAQLDLLDSEAVAAYLEAGRFDAVIHCATENATVNARRDRARVLDSNLRMYHNLARCRPAYGRMLSLGSGAEYDRAHWQPHMSEEDFDRHVPADDYGFSKYLISKHAAAAEGIWNLRLFGVFGPYEDWEIRFISNACVRALCDLPITIRQNVNFDYLYIPDLVPVIEWFLRADPRHKEYNVCTGRVCDLRTLAAMVLEVSGKNLPIQVAQEGWGREYSGDNRRLLAETGPLAWTPLREAIVRLYAWYESRKADFAGLGR